MLRFVRAVAHIRIHPCLSQSGILFDGSALLLIFIRPFVDGHGGCFQDGVITNKDAGNIHLQVFMWTVASSWVHAWVWDAGSHGRCLLAFLTTCATVPQSGPALAVDSCPLCLVTAHAKHLCRSSSPICMSSVVKHSNGFLTCYIESFVSLLLTFGEFFFVFLFFCFLSFLDINALSDRVCKHFLPVCVLTSQFLPS